jgi:Zn finger protein HypA/HybF involved in hydrogenase expression
MGSKVKAICKCGVNKDILIGGGMRSFKYECLFPCLCENCEEVVEVNLYDSNLRCPSCKDNNLIPYDDDRVKGVKGDQNVITWNANWKLGRELILTNGSYKCPKCKNLSLGFQRLMFKWD